MSLLNLDYKILTTILATSMNGMLGSYIHQDQAIKMKIFLELLFSFQNLIIHIPMKWTNKIQELLNGFLWHNKKPMKMLVLQQRVQDGGIAFPYICKYYQVSRLAAMIVWWKQEDQHTSGNGAI